MRVTCGAGDAKAEGDENSLTAEHAPASDAASDRARDVLAQPKLIFCSRQSAMVSMCSLFKLLRIIARLNRIYLPNRAEMR